MGSAQLSARSLSDFDAFGQRAQVAPQQSRRGLGIASACVT